MGAINYNMTRNGYPTASGPSIATMDRYRPNDTAEEVANGNDHVSEALNVGGQASPLVGLFVFAALCIGVYMIAKYFGEEGDFSNIKSTPYNALFISLVAVAGIPVWKYLFTMVKVPGVSTWVLSS